MEIANMDEEILAELMDIRHVLEGIENLLGSINDTLQAIEINTV